MDIECCNRVRHIKVGGVIYNYVLKCNLLECNEAWCNTRRAIIEIAPHKYAQIYSDKEITEQEIESVVMEHLTNHK